MTTHLTPLGQAQWSGGGSAKPRGIFYECGPGPPHCRGKPLAPPAPFDYSKTEYLAPRPAGTQWFQVQVTDTHGVCGLYYSGCRVLHDIPGQADVGICTTPHYPPPPELFFHVNGMDCILVETASWPVLRPNPATWPDYVGYTGDPTTAGGEGPPESYFDYADFRVDVFAQGEEAGGYVWGFFAEILCYAEVDDSDTTPAVGTVNFGLIRRGTFYGYEPTRP